jgi:hypothetical protein
MFLYVTGCTVCGTRHDEQRVAVGWRLRHQVRADDALRAGPIVDDPGLMLAFLEFRCDYARDDVRRPAGRKAIDDPHRPSPDSFAQAPLL